MDERQATAEAIADHLRSLDDCECEHGLSTAELDRAQEELRLRMPVLWCDVLRLVHPVALPAPPRDPDGVRRWVRYPDWRLRDTARRA